MSGPDRVIRRTRRPTRVGAILAVVVCAIPVLLLAGIGSPPASARGPVPAAATPTSANATVRFDANLSPAATVSVGLGFPVSLNVSGGYIDPGSELLSAVAFAAPANATVQFSAPGFSHALPIHPLGSYGPYTVPGLTYSYLGVNFTLSLSTRGVVLALGASGGADPTAPGNLSWDGTGSTSIPVRTSAAAVPGAVIPVSVSDLRYELTVAVNATGDLVPGHPTTIPILPATPLAAVNGTPNAVNATFVVVAAPSITGFTAEPSTVAAGTPTNLSVLTTGGDPPLTFQYSGLPDGCPSANTSFLSCTPADVGRYAVTVTVTDRQGFHANATTTLEVVEARGSTGPTPVGGLGSLAPWEIALLIAGVAVLAAVVGVFVGRRRPPAPAVAPAP